MTPIPAKIRRILERMPRMEMCECIWHPEFGACQGRIEWHHTLTYAGRQIQEVFAIVGVCKKHHDAVNGNRQVREWLVKRSLEMATDGELARYPNRDWSRLKEYLGIKNA